MNSQNQASIKKAFSTQSIRHGKSLNKQSGAIVFMPVAGLVFMVGMAGSVFVHQKSVKEADLAKAAQALPAAIQIEPSKNNEDANNQMVISTAETMWTDVLETE